jgi:hypothetical protein
MILLEIKILEFSTNSLRAKNKLAKTTKTTLNMRVVSKQEGAIKNLYMKEATLVEEAIRPLQDLLEIIPPKEAKQDNQDRIKHILKTLHLQAIKRKISLPDKLIIINL